MANISISQMRFSREINSGIKKIVKPIFDGIDLEIKDGERVGIIGRNGAGKTTLLRLMSGILEPDSGRIVIEGDVNSILDSGFGLDQALTGRENAYSRMILRGLKRREARIKLQKIREFAELEESFDHPVKTYSSGMVMRLVFSTDLAINSGGALLIDEGFGHADASFQVKAQVEINKLLNTATLLVLTSHNEVLLREFCSRGILLGPKGIAFDGSIDEALDIYHNEVKAP